MKNEAIISNIIEILYPEGNLDNEWVPELLDLIAQELEHTDIVKRMRTERKASMK